MSSSTNAGGLKNLWNEDDESFEVQVPDFHFDWGVDKGLKETDNTSTDAAPIQRFSSLDISKKIPSRPTSLSPPASQPGSSFSQAKATPPPRYNKSARSSLSSVNAAALTDASTASGSSLVPTPPGIGFSSGTRSISSQNLDSGGSGTGGSGRIYGGGRKFQRVVSAPITRSKLDQEDNAMLTVGDASILSSSTASHTATIRPQLMHTNSASSIDNETSATFTLSRTSNYMTPGVTDRTLTSAARSTGRRLGGLSKFGGPARRVVPALETEDIQEEPDKPSPVLMNSPPRNTPSPPPATRSSRSTTLPSSVNESSAHSHLHSRTQSRNSPVQHFDRPSATVEEAIPNLERSQQRSNPDPQLGYQSAGLRETVMLSNRPDENDRPFRPFSSTVHQNSANADTADHLPQAYDHRNNMGSSSSQLLRRSPPALQRHSPPPHPLRAVRPAPAISNAYEPQPPPSNPVVPITQPVQTGRMDQYSQASLPQSMQPQAIPAPAATRTSFLVNSIPYERLQRLGKGGSSTVYSVLYSAPPKKRIIYALKVVQLDRADSETYQSYTNEIELLKRLRGHDRVIQLIDHQITFGQGNRPHRLLMVMECGEIDFAALLDEQRGKAININFVGLYWEQIGTVNYMSPEAIQRMNNQKVLKMIYGSPPFQHIGGGPLAKMQVIADPRHVVDYPEIAVPKTTVGVGLDAPAVPPGSTPITQKQMEIMVNFILREHGLPELSSEDRTAEDLFSQLEMQNALSE
ncbi:uncharacterized protein L201_006290 [Kwoniella dendrophila CBS 6074]|uniref:Protein kinase domain-containing protein n=1 Tax=Kwoniella dendrophila CBS 6074 TaxID=1295534 RepID=A0AAX4K3A1_9TREE